MCKLPPTGVHRTTPLRCVPQTEPSSDQYNNKQETTQNKATTRGRTPPKKHPTNINHQNQLDATEPQQKERSVALMRASE
jgi:hypothetical protein